MSSDLKQLSDDAASALSVGEADKAQRLYQTILSENPELIEAVYALGTIAFQKKDYRTALPLLDKAAMAEPEAVDIAYNYACCLAAAGNSLGALQQLQRATQYCRDDAYFVPLIADLSIRLGEPAAAITLLSRLSKLTPADQLLLANAQGMLGNWREAVNVLKYLHETIKDDPVVAEKLSLAAGNLRDYDIAISAFEHYLRLITPTSYDYLRFADLLLIAQRVDRCEQAIQIAKDKGEDSAEIHLLQARSERLKGDDEAVLLALEKVLSRQPKNGQAWAIKVELANGSQVDSLINLLKAELVESEELNRISKWHQALLHYALAELYDRNSNFEYAAAALRNANSLQYSDLEQSNSYYNPEVTQQQTKETIQAFSADVFEQSDALIKEEQKSIQPIFIVGMPRSGTTLVERIIGQNERVFCGGEQESMEFVAAHYKHQERNNRVDPPAELGASGWAKLRNMYLEKLPEISKPIFTDKLPHNFRNVGLILKMFPEAKIIQMHRDARDVCMSIYQRAFAPGHNYANRWEDLLHFNAQAESLMAHWSSLHSSKIMDLQYENLVRDPEYYAKQLIEFLGFEWHESYLDFHKTVNISFTFSERQVRQPITDNRIGRWQRYEKFIPELAEPSASKEP